MRQPIAGCLLVALAAGAADPAPVGREMTAERFQDWLHYNNFGRSALEVGDLERASKCFRMAIDIASPAVANDPQPLARSYTDLSLVLVKQGRAVEAGPMAEWALKVREQRFGEDSVPAAQTLHVLALIATEQRQYPRAEALLSRTLRIWERRLKQTDPQLVLYLNDLASLYLFQRKYAQAESLFQRVVEMPTRDLPANHPDRAIGLIGLASLTAARGEKDRAEAYDRQLLTLLDRMPGAYYPSIAGALEPYLAQLRALGWAGEAGELETQARATREGRNAAESLPGDRSRIPMRRRPL
jgi:tetratricopeptide (TPR) repeat protein